MQCSRKRVQPLKKKRKKSRFLDFQKNVKKRNHLVMQPLITQLPEVSTGKSRSPTSNILLRCVDTRNHSSITCSCDSGIPQGSVLGSLLFTAFVAPVTKLIDSYGIGYVNLLMTHDTQLLVTMSTANTTSALEVLSHCSAAVRLWFLRNGLMFVRYGE